MRRERDGRQKRENVDSSESAQTDISHLAKKHADTVAQVVASIGWLSLKAMIP
jgi:hypothetical protein